MSTDLRQLRADAPLVHACVLLSGGMDSVAALHWARARCTDVRAVAFDYGQPARDHELFAAQTIARDLGVPYARLSLADTLRTGLGLLRYDLPPHDPGAQSTHAAFLPGRNAVFCTIAAAHAAAWWKNGTLDLVVGANADDATGFPDCRARFFEMLAGTIRLGYAREVRIRAPFVELTKTTVLAAADDAARADIARSWSCYHRTGPCEVCSPCVLRRAAFAAVGLADRATPAAQSGGDPHREIGR